MTALARHQSIAITWVRNGEIGQLTIGGEHWASVEWSEKRQQWCVEDAEGRCLTHTASIRGSAASKEEAVALAEAMIRDGRMPDPETARTEATERRRAAREKRKRQPAQIRKREEREAAREASRLAWEIEAKERDAQPLYETLDEAFDLGDPELWQSNSFAALKPRLVLHVDAAIAELASTVADENRRHGRGDHWGNGAKLDRAKAIYRKLTGAEWAPRLSRMSQLMAQIEARTAKQEGEAAAGEGES
jgi:hypothetical protein